MTKKEKFIHYCKNKVADLGITDFIDYDNTIQQTKVLATGSIRDFGLVKIIRLEEDSENFTCINTENKIVCDTPMINIFTYIGKMEFLRIDTTLYNEILEYWQDIDFDYYIIED